MPSWFKCCQADRHVAVQSQGASTSVPSTKTKNKEVTNNRSDHEFDDDKEAVQKWRRQHEQYLPRREEEKKEIEPADDSSSDASSFGVDATNRPVKISPRAVQAWQQRQQEQTQQQQQQQQPQVATARATPTTPEPPLQMSASQSLDGTSSLHSEPKMNRPARTRPPRTQLPPIKHVDDEMAVVAAMVTPEPTPSFGSSPGRSTSSHRSRHSRQSQHSGQIHQQQYQQHCHSSSQQQQHHNQLSPPPQMRLTYSNASASSHTSKRSNKNHRNSPSYARQHDHEGFVDAMIRETALGKTTTSTRSNTTERSWSNSREESHSSDDDDDNDERIQGQVFLQVSAHDAISPRSSVDENSATASYSYYDDTASLSDILSEPLSEVPSFVDSDTRERYILACRLLKARMLQASPPPIMPMERELLQDLLNRFQLSKDAGSDVAYEALSNILQRENDPIVYSHSGSRDGGGDDDIDNDDENSVDETSDELAACHTRSTSQGDFSIQEEEEGFNTVLRTQHIRDEKSAKGMSSLVEKEQLKLPVEQPTSSLVRYDGWNPAALKEPYPFEIMGLSQDTPTETRVLTPALMEALRGFFPYAISEDHFWLKFSLVRDGASVRSLLDKVKTSKHTVLCIETEDGGVFGAFCSAPWRSHSQKKWFGTGEAFLWRLKQSRYATATGDDGRNDRIPNNEMEVYPCTGHDDLVQYCTHSTLAVGGGAWKDAPCPYPEEPQGIGLLVDGDLEGGETNSCATFANPRLYGRSTTSNEFTIRNLEVWTLTPCGTIAFAEQLERQKYLLEQHAQSASPPTRIPGR